MALELIPAPETAEDDPTLLLSRAAAASAPLVSQRRPAPDLQEATFEQAKHPRWPAKTPGGLGGEFMRVGQVFSFGGKTWEIANILQDGRIIAHEASGKTSAALTREFHAADTPGDAQTLTGATRPPARAIKGGKLHDQSDVTVVDPYNDPSTHDPAIPIPPASSVTAEQWQRFGRLEQLHYTDLQTRFGKHTASGASALVKKAYTDYEVEIQNIVHGGYASQYGASTGFTLSLTSIFHNLFGGDTKKLEAVRAKRERALELQGRIRDANAWDLYNRTRSPDLAVGHKDSEHGADWWKGNFITGDKPVMSGLSQSFQYRRTWFGSVVLMTPVSIRHIVMSTYSTGPLKNAAKEFTGEREVAIGTQFRVDAKRSMAFHHSELPSGYIQWLENTTTTPQGGAHLERFKAAVEGGDPLPIPPPPPHINMQGEGFLPPPQGAAEALAEYAEQLPAIQTEVYDPAKLPKAMPWANTDAKGQPEAKIALESGFKPGDFMMGLKGTLYWVGPDPNDPEGFGLRYHKLVPNGSGSLAFSGESYRFEGGGKNKYYKLKGNVAPHTEEKVEFDEEAWVFSDQKATPISKMQTSDKFKVEGTPYEITGLPNAGTATIRDLNSGIVGTINSDYQTVPLAPKEGYIPAGLKQKAAKGMSLAYNGKKHIVTAVKKDGTISIRPSTGGKVVPLAPDDDALTGLFDHAQWKQGGKVKAGDLDVGEMFHGGRGSVIRPYRITKKDESWVYWQNLDNGQEGKFLLKKKVRALESQGGVGEDKVPETPTAVTGPPVETNPTPNSLTILAALKIGDRFKGPSPQGTQYEITAILPDSEQPKVKAAVVTSDGTLGAVGAFPATMDVVYTHPAAEVQDATPPPGVHHGFDEGQTIEMKKANGKSWVAEVVGSGIGPTGKPVVKVTAGTKGKIYTVGLDKVVTSGATAHEPTPSPGAAAAAAAKGPDVKLMDAPIGVVVYYEPLNSSHEGGLFRVVDKSASGKAILQHSGEDLTITAESSAVGTLLHPPEAPAASHHDQALDSLPDATSWFPAYKSAWGTGGAYKHDKVSEMQSGTVFQDKTGKLWKVQTPGATPIITDGSSNYKINGSLRGRARPDEQVDGPPVVPTEMDAPPPTLPEVESAVPKPKLLMDYAEGGMVSLKDRAGKVVTKLANGDVIVQMPKSDKGWAGELAIEKYPGDIYPEDIVPQTVPAFQIESLPPPPNAVEKPISDYAVGSMIKLPEGNVEVVAKLAGGDIVARFPDGTLANLPGPAYPDEIEKPEPETEIVGTIGTDVDEPGAVAQIHETLAELSKGDEFLGSNDHPWTVVAQLTGGQGAVIKSLETGDMKTVGGQVPLDNVGVPEVAPAAAHVDTPLATNPPNTPYVQTLKAKIISDYGGMFKPPSIDLAGYKSKWGSGGTYKHDELLDLEPGDTFQDKSGAHFVMVESQTGGMVLIWSKSDGSPYRVQGKTRVRRV